MQTIRIDKGVPLPFGAAGQRGNKYRLRELEIGDSVFVPVEMDNRYLVRAQITNATIKTGFKFTGRTVDGGMRIWRLS